MVFLVVSSLIGDEHMMSVLAGVRQQAQTALRKLTMKDEKDPLPILVESVTKQTLALIPELFQYLFVVLRKEHNPNFPRIATVCQVRDTKAPDRQKMLAKGMSKLLVDVANARAYQILFSSTTEHYIVDHNATRSARVLEARFQAIRERNKLLKFNNFDELEGTIYQDKPCTYDVLHEPHKIRLENDVVDLTDSDDSGIEPVFL